MSPNSTSDGDEKGNFTFWLRKSLVDDARRLKAQGQLQPNAVVEKALAEAVDTAKLPGKEQLLRRLRTARLERRSGPDYQLGFQRGEQWARDVASWAEITKYAGLNHDDVVVKYFEQQFGEEAGFDGAFTTPADEEEAPLFKAPGDEQFVSSAHRLQQHWRGWLDGVKSVHELVRDGMEVVDVPGFAEARAHFAKTASDEFRTGYAKALEVAKDLNLTDLEMFAEKGFAIKPWLEYMKSGVEYAVMDHPDKVEFDPSLPALMNALGTLADPIGFELPTPTRSFVAGFTQALQDLWGSLSEPTDALPRPSDSADRSTPLTPPTSDISSNLDPDDVPF